MMNNQNNQSQQEQKYNISDKKSQFNNQNDLLPAPVRKISKLSNDIIPGQMRKISIERKIIKDPIEILKLNKKIRTKDQLIILCSYFKDFQNLKIIQHQSNFSEKIGQFIDKCSYEKYNKGDFIFHTMDKNDYLYFVLKGEVVGYAKRSEKNMNNNNQLNIIYDGVNSSSQINQNEMISHQEEESITLLKINNSKLGNYFEREGKGRCKYNQIQVYKECQSFGDLGKKNKTFSTVAKTDQVEVIKIQNKDFLQIFDFLEKKLSLTIQTLRKQFEGIISDRILINLSYLFEEDGEVLTTGEYIYKDFQPVDKIYIVKEGHLDLVKKVKNFKGRYVEKNISILSQGELFGYESLVQIKQENSEKEIKLNADGEEIKENIPEMKQEHKYSCKSTTENASIYWLDLNMLSRHSDYEDFLIYLTKIGEKKAIYYEERIQKMLKVEEKQHSEVQSPSKQRDQKLSFKDAIQGMIIRQNSNMFDQSPSYNSLSNINDELLSSPNLQKKKSQNQTIKSALDKVENQIQNFNFQRQSSLLLTKQQRQSESLSPESSPLLKKYQTFNQIPYSNQPSVVFQEIIPERDESPVSQNNELKLQFQKNRNHSSNDERQFSQNLINDSQINNVKKLNMSRGSFSSTYEAGFQLKPIYNNNNINNNNNLYNKQNNQHNQIPISGSKLSSSEYSPNLIQSISPFSSPVKIRTIRGYTDQSKDNKTIKGITTDKDNLARRNQQSYNNLTNINLLNQIDEELSKFKKKKRSHEENQEDMKSFSQQPDKRLLRSNSSKLLQRKRENNESSYSNLSISQMDQLIKSKEEIVSNKIIPKNVQLVSSGLPTFEESERIQRLLKKFNTKVLNPNISISAIHNITASANNYSPTQIKKGSMGNSINQSANSSLNISLTKIMKNKQANGDQNEQYTNQIKSPIKIKSYSKINILEDEDMNNVSKSLTNLVQLKFQQSRNSSPLTNENYRDQDEYYQYDDNDDSSQNIFKFTCESPKLKLQLKQKLPDQNIDSIIDHNYTQKQPVNTIDEIQNQSEIQDTIITLSLKSQNSKQKSAKYIETRNNEIPKSQIITNQLPKIKSINDYQNIKNLISKSKPSRESLSPIENNSNNLKVKMENKGVSAFEEDNNNDNVNSNSNSNINNNKQKLINYNLFPNFQSNRNSSCHSIPNQNNENILQSRNTRSSSGSLGLIQQEHTPLILKPKLSQSSQQNNLIDQKSSSRVTLQTGEKKKRNSQISFNQSLIKKSLIRHSLHKKYQQVVSSSPFRDKIIKIGEQNILYQDQSQNQSHIFSGIINGQSDQQSANKNNSKLKLNNLNKHFLLEPSTQSQVFSTSLENSRSQSQSQSLQKSHADHKQQLQLSQNLTFQNNNNNNHVNMKQFPKTLAQSTRFNSVEKLRNISSLHQMFTTPQKFDPNYNYNLKNTNNNNIGVGSNTQLNWQNGSGSSSNTPEKILFTPQSTIQSAVPARQAALQSLYTLISTQKNQDTLLTKSSLQITSITNRNTQQNNYSNILKILQPTPQLEIPSRQKKGFSLHSKI